MATSTTAAPSSNTQVLSQMIAEAEGQLSPRSQSVISTTTHYNSEKTHCPRGHAMVGPNFIASKATHGRACKSCDNAARLARRRNMTGAIREAFIQLDADRRYAKAIQDHFNSLEVVNV